MNRGRKEYSREYLLEKLDEACELLGRPIGSRELERMKGFPGKTQYGLKFGGVNNALILIGRTPNFIRNPRGIENDKRTPYKLRFTVFERDNFTCQYCGFTPQDGAKLVTDHIHPFSKGGKTTIENLVTSCWDCNAGKRDAILDTKKAQRLFQDGEPLASCVD